MSNLFDEFSKPSFADWKDKIIADLKGKPESLVERNNEIEQINYTCYQHDETSSNRNEVPGQPSFVRGSLKTDNQWRNCATVAVKDCELANKEALNCLNLGADALRFELESPVSDWNALLKEIQLEYIHTTFVLYTIEDFKSIANLYPELPSYISFEIDLVENEMLRTYTDDILTYAANNQRHVLNANGFGVYSIGANTWQEVAYQLSTAHHYLVNLLEKGATIDEAAACIHFTSGTGENYFFEIAKHRVLKQLWAKIIEAYSPNHNCTYHTAITAISGQRNKSVKDPHTNLLRQTTEVMSALSAGVDSISVLPHEMNTSKGVGTLSRRMSINIPTILKEESYFDKVIDPLGGSYSLDTLTNEIANKAWSLFQTLEAKGGIPSVEAISHLKEQIDKTRAIRIERAQSGADLLIGINKYDNIESVSNDWNINKTYLGKTYLILEKEIQKIEA